MFDQDAGQIRGATEASFEVYLYPPTAVPPMPSWEAFGGCETLDAGNGHIGASDRHAMKPAADESGRTTNEASLADQARQSFEAGRTQGFEQGRAAEREALAASLKAKEQIRAEQVAHLAEIFNLERNRYFAAVEPEIVKLALAIAARILRREAQMDPLLLTGAVRVALGQLSASTEVRLRVPAAELDLWSDTIAHLPRLAARPTVLAGEGMRLGDCRLETELGNVDLGLRAQLGEIEHGFFDRATASPPPPKPTHVSEDMSE